MLEKRGCHELVYLRETIIAMSEQSHFVSSLMFLIDKSDLPVVMEKFRTLSGVSKVFKKIYAAFLTGAA